MDTETCRFLENILERAVDMVKYAEAKHVILIGFAGASIFGLSKLFISIDTTNIFFLTYCIAFVGFSGLAIVISLSSFIPILGKLLNTHRNDAARSVNPFYFGDAARRDPDTYMKTLEGALENQTELGANHLIAEEIIINACCSTDIVAPHSHAN
uniref:Pycsar effector protein domain-containing protein n=1 Tax=Candidatus Kentrum sp. TUN TaxID=2126343 RepID=A0A451AA37_9GAMM|nr:MAG: hypothetical protein BECKTUN1418F_GA0071002_10905 [Candidatus Kentron sp. TUN]VFK62879.1 MAG: hypothetical protein BECKTUN1418E_GA0071001_10886 [Candidatus Kentron sp. TUN]